MTEKSTFFYKETPKGRVNLQDAFFKALPVDGNFDSPVQTRQIKIK